MVDWVEPNEMSYQAFEWVLHHSDTKGADRLVHLTIAFYAGIDEWDAWPSLDLLAERTLLSRRTVIRSLDNLEDRGYLKRTRGHGRGNPSRYQLLHEKVTSTPTKGDTTPPFKGDILTRKGDTDDDKRCHSWHQKRYEELEEVVPTKGDTTPPLKPTPKTTPRCPTCQHLTHDCTCGHPLVGPGPIRDTLNGLRYTEGPPT